MTEMSIPCTGPDGPVQAVLLTPDHDEGRVVYVQPARSGRQEHHRLLTQHLAQMVNSGAMGLMEARRHLQEAGLL